ncbi:MAG: cob(I)yrinic acid a,c-diamide adenosyltransferase [Deltaproteobacteria bacterium]|jgi:cob(I)alamin adenosyltransferase|nr:cob(I)yrinic acid a,c-diamide adenosyltransferase [Deltaproteobacteria bacterium]
MSITTKTGDNGTTGFIGKSRLSKNSARTEVLGTLDELSSQLGVVYAQMGVVDEDRQLVLEIQKNLPRISAEIASDNLEALDIMLIGPGDAAKVERLSHKLENSIEPLEGLVIVGGGNNVSAAFDLARAVCRRTERRLVNYFEIEQSLDQEGTKSIMKYINRLSDLLFLLARKKETRRIYFNNKQ